MADKKTDKNRAISFDDSVNISTDLGNDFYINVDFNFDYNGLKDILSYDSSDHDDAENVSDGTDESINRAWNMFNDPFMRNCDKLLLNINKRFKKWEKLYKKHKNKKEKIYVLFCDKYAEKIF